MTDFPVVGGKDLPETMAAVHLLGHGGFEQLVYRTDVAVPRAASGGVVIEVGAAGVNNTDINTRIGWYSKAVTGDTNSGGAGGFSEVDSGDASWSGEALVFPRIQGADCAGRIVSVGSGVDAGRIGERVLVRPMMQNPLRDSAYHCWTLGSECDGAFAQYVSVPSVEAFAIDCDWSDVELASIPCAYSTAENMLHRIGLGSERVLITGASGGVGSAAVQLAKCRGAYVIAVAGIEKSDALLGLGADRVLARGADFVEALGAESVDVVVDLVGGGSWGCLLDVLRRGGRYITAGAIAGPIVGLDLRTLYLKDLTLKGSTWQDVEVFENLVGLIEAGRLKPLVAATFPLEEIAEAQAMFLDKGFVGKIVLEIPPVGDGGI